MNAPARKKSSMQNKLVLALKTRHEEGEALTVAWSLSEDRGENHTRQKCNEIFLPMEVKEEDWVR